MSQQAPTPTQTLRIERHFQVSPEIAFDTLTKPERMVVWWGPGVDFDIDLRVGGQWTITRRAGDATYVATGLYQQVERPSRLRYTYTMPQFSPNTDIITVSITPTPAVHTPEDHSPAGCIFIFEHSGPDIAQELAELAPGETSASEAGWQQGFDLMEAAWAKESSGG
ncbi:MAG: SRPBCC domain-containing protein [Acidobacteriota bacterium]